MPRGVYDRSKKKKLALPKDLVAKLRPRKHSGKGDNLSLTGPTGVAHAVRQQPIEQSINIPDAGLVLKINNKHGRVITTLDIDGDGIVIYPSNARRGKKPRPRIQWSKLFGILKFFDLNK